MKNPASCSVGGVLLLLLSCGGSDAPAAGPERAATTDEPVSSTAAPADRGRDRDREGGSTPPAPLLDAEPFDSATNGALHGAILFVGAPPERFELGADSVKECHQEGVEHLSETVLVRDGKLQNVYVYLKRGWEDLAVPAPPTEPAELDQKGCLYTPHVMAIQAGRPLLVRNADPTTHNVNCKAPRNGVSKNVNQGKGQEPVRFTTTRAERPMSFKCDLHPWMQAWVYVEEHPWFAVSDAAGAFSIPDVPPGDYTVEAVHEKYGSTRGKVTVESGRSTGFTLSFSAD
jgi:hypothetical protein